ncbi:HlyC/CorC family transporter [Parasulfuritortus cantonensis]|uniref:HlyC/CorC family transporter n=1 Tax=Parasulfuritortus cantonensis TaxID=2528202 RepID=UPI0030B7FDEA
MILSGFFSGSETSMMAVNRYRLKTLAKGNNRGAKLAEWLLARTDKLLSVILLGNNLVNSAAAALVTVVSFRVFGENEISLTLATVLVTFLILVFSEVTPKVIGASYPERIVPVVSYPLALLLKLLHPVIWFINLFVHGQLRLLRLKVVEEGGGNRMGVEELRTLLAESGSFLPQSHRSMLLNLFDLEKLTVDDVMLPRGEIEAIDVDSAADETVQHLQTSHHAHLPVYRDELNEIVGIVHVRRALAHIGADGFDAEAFRQGLKAAYFVPSGTPLLTQLSQFKENRQSLGLVVDEYGELLGLITVEDVLEEIVGEFSGVNPLQGNGWVADEEGGYLVEGTISLRDLNRKLGLALPLEGARTLNGLIMEYLEAMPEAGVTIKVAGCTVEIVQVTGRKVKTARVRPENRS